MPPPCFLRCCVTYQETVGWANSGDINSIAQFTSAFFGTFGVMQLLAVLLIGPALAAGTIAQERERRTMEYLYTTPLSNLEIVIGKLGGRVLQILYFILSGVPVLALAMLLGGIAPQAIVSLTAITLSTVLFVAMVSMAVSAWTAKARDAVVRAYLVFFCLWVLPLPAQMLRSLNLGYTWMWPLVEQVIIANPVATFTLILEGRGPVGSGDRPVVAAAGPGAEPDAGGRGRARAGDPFHAPHPSAAIEQTGPQAPLANPVLSRPDRRQSHVLERDCMPSPVPRGWACWAMG